MCWYQNQQHKTSTANSNVTSCTGKNQCHETATSRRRKRVSFRDTCTVQRVEHRSSMSKEEVRACYYTHEELEDFQSQARVICKNLQLCDKENASSYDVDTVRGLELRRSVDRQKRKYLTIQCILMAQKRLTNLNQLAGLALRCSQWCTQVAVAEAQRDFILACAEPQQEHSLPQLPPLTPFPLPMKHFGSPTKRKSYGTESPASREAEERRVRRRTCG